MYKVLKNKSNFNTRVEIGLRMMFLLNNLKPSKLDLDKLNYFDYLLLYLNDETLQIDSLHPEYPMMMIELFSKEELIKKALLYMGSKALISIECEENGIVYFANANTNWFLNGLPNNEYSQLLIERIDIIKKKFGDYSTEELKELIRKEIDKRENKFKDFFPYE